MPALILVLLAVGLGGCGYLLRRHRNRSRDPRPAAVPALVAIAPRASAGIVAEPPADQPATPALSQTWSIADDEEDGIPTALFRPSDDPSFAAFLAEERSAEGARTRR